MSLDIGQILGDWPYDPGRVTVRKIVGEDGREKIQLRLDLGLLQMETAGRPDGQRPHGQESLLAHYEQKLAEHKHAKGTDEGFELSEDACQALRAEGLMYYHRYLAAFVLGSYETVQRDTKRNLRVFDLCATYALSPVDRVSLEQYRPYVMMMHARARAHVALNANRTKAALAAVHEGIEQIEDFYRRTGQEEALSSCGEIALLEDMAGDIKAKIPIDPVEKIRRELARAVEEERYEDAATLHKRLRRAVGGI